jgi:hypothetical protein
MPEHEVVKRFELDGGRDDGERRITDASVDESLFSVATRFVLGRAEGKRP